ncbi:MULTISPECIES: copper resistance CopC family protein [Streptomycetaceae]|uniref:copper resistance CopC family protein n=1 Tax=unclassified Streptomyces TaxID=2593676 RepID=UPI00337465CC
MPAVFLAVVSALLGLLLVVAPASPAWAHARLVASSPASGSVVAHSPKMITLSFDGPVKQQFTTVLVSGPGGTSYSDGAPSALNNDVQQEVKPLPVGEIQVTWRTVAADGAPLQGRYTFTSTDAAGASSAEAATASPRAGDAVARPWSPWWLAAGVALLAVLALLGFGLLRAVRSPRRP